MSTQIAVHELLITLQWMRVYGDNETGLYFTRIYLYTLNKNTHTTSIKQPIYNIIAKKLLI